MAEPPPDLSDEEAIALVRAAAARGLSVPRRQTQSDLVHADIDLEDAAKLISACSLDCLHRHEPDDKYPERPFYVVILKMDIPNHSVPFYVKVGLRLPSLTQGRLISFHPWGMHDRGN